MAVQAGGRAPYASTGSIISVINKHRQVGLRSVDLSTLQRIGVTEALAPRTLQTLVLLDFYDEKGQVTPAFDALRKVGEQDFKPKLAELLQEAYAEILTVLDPATATQLDVENAFRGFEPTGQLGRMVQLFIGLFRFVGVMPEPAKSRRTRTATPTVTRTPTVNRPRTEQKSSPPTSPSPPPPAPPGSSGDTYQVALQSGGSVSVMVDVNLFDLTSADRKFVIDLVDQLKGYPQVENRDGDGSDDEGGGPAPTEPPQGPSTHPR